MGKRQRGRSAQPGPSPAAKVVVGVLGVLGGALLLSAALSLTGFASVGVWLALRAGDFPFLVGALLLIALAIFSVAVAGPNLLRGISFHLVGVLSPFLLGTAFPPFERLRVAGGIIYIGAWCWVYLGEILVRLVRSRSAARG